jgi:hypothetical protein
MNRCTAQTKRKPSSPQELIERLERRRLLSSVIASNLDAPASLQIDAGQVYFTDNVGSSAVIKSVPSQGGPLSTIVDLPAIYDSGAYRGIGAYSIDADTISGEYGGYESLNLFSAPKAGGAVTTLANVGGAHFLGATGGYVYFMQNFSEIDRMPLTGGASTQLLTGYFARSSAIDASALYFVDYFTKNVFRLDLQTFAVATIFGGNNAEGSIFIDANNIYFNLAGNIESVPKAGGVPTTLVSDGTATGYASDGTNVYFVDSVDEGIHKVPVVGGLTSLVASVAAGTQVTSIAVDDARIYWALAGASANTGEILETSKQVLSNPVLSFPDAGDAVSGTPHFSLSASDPNGKAVKFTIQLTNGSQMLSFDTNFVASNSDAGLTIPEKSRLSPGPWMWRAQAADKAGLISDWSDFVDFNVSQGLDFSFGKTSPSSWKKIGNAGSTFAIADGWGGRSEFKTIDTQLARAHTANLGTAVYCLLNFDNEKQSGSFQVLKALDAAGSEAQFLSFIAIDVELPAGFRKTVNVIDRISEAVKQVRDLGIVPVIYTSRMYWRIMTGDSKLFGDIPLWDAKPDDVADLDRDSNKPWDPYGGWKSRAGKQYSQEQPDFRLQADFDVFDPSLFHSTGISPELQVSLPVPDIATDASIQSVATALLKRGDDDDGASFDRFLA